LTFYLVFKDHFCTLFRCALVIYQIEIPMSTTKLIFFVFLSFFVVLCILLTLFLHSFSLCTSNIPN